MSRRSVHPADRIVAAHLVVQVVRANPGGPTTSSCRGLPLLANSRQRIRPNSKCFIEAQHLEQDRIRVLARAYPLGQLSVVLELL